MLQQAAAPIVRCFFKLLTAGSLVPCLAMLSLWVRSYWVSDEFYIIYSDRGGDWVQFFRGIYEDSSPSSRLAWASMAAKIWSVGSRS